MRHWFWLFVSSCVLLGGLESNFKDCPALLIEKILRLISCRCFRIVLSWSSPTAMFCGILNSMILQKETIICFCVLLSDCLDVRSGTRQSQPESASDWRGMFSWSSWSIRFGNIDLTWPGRVWLSRSLQPRDSEENRPESWMRKCVCCMSDSRMSSGYSRSGLISDSSRWTTKSTGLRKWLQWHSKAESLWSPEVGHLQRANFLIDFGESPTKKADTGRPLSVMASKAAVLGEEWRVSTLWYRLIGNAWLFTGNAWLRKMKSDWNEQNSSLW